MIKIDRFEKNISNLCFLYIVYIFMYGIVIKFTISNDLLFQVKTYIPEIMLLIISVMCIFKDNAKVKIKKKAFVLLVYALMVFAVNLIIHGMNEQALYCIRDIYIPLVTFCLLLNIAVSDTTVSRFTSILITFFKFYLIAGLILAIIQQIFGWEWAGSFYTGYVFYEQDPISKVKIAHNLGLLRAPSLSGNFATFGYYCLIAGIFVGSYTNELYKRWFWYIITFVCMLLATNKSAIVAFSVALILGTTVSLRTQSKLINRLIIIAVGGIAGISALLLTGDNSDTGLFTSVFARFEVWASIFEETSVWEIIFPYKQFLYGSGLEGALGFWDNTYLYSMFSQGIVGTILWFSLVRKVYHFKVSNVNMSSQTFVYGITIALLVLALTVNITQGRGFLAPYLLLLGFGATIRCMTEKN